jgi:hypothetical protein
VSEERFLAALPSRSASQIDRAVLICAFLKDRQGKPATSVREILDYFERAHLARPNQTRLAERITGDSRISIRAGQVRSLAGGDTYFRDTYPELCEDAGDPATSLNEATKARLQATPLIGHDHLNDLEKMLELYASLHVLENSMRGLVEKVLSKHLGDEWWDVASSAAQKRKQVDRMQKEQDRKWLPARSDLGPLYALDWSDLISIMRKYDGLFIPIFGTIDFLHRFFDLGSLRNVVAHNGFVADVEQFNRVNLALYDWQKQVGPKLSGL